MHGPLVDFLPAHPSTPDVKDASTIYHIAASADWEAARARGRYEVESLQSEGFIHASARERVLWVADRFYRGRADLVLLRIDEDRVTSEVRHDLTPDGVFPHIYGPLNLDAVVDVQPFRPQADGTFSFPSCWIADPRM